MCVSFIGGVWMFLYIYGTFRSFSIARVGILKFILLLLTGVVVTPFKVLIENIAVVWGLFTPKHTFFVVKKDVIQYVWNRSSKSSFHFHHGRWISVPNLYARLSCQINLWDRQPEDFLFSLVFFDFFVDISFHGNNLSSFGKNFNEYYEHDVYGSSQHQVLLINVLLLMHHLFRAAISD